MFKLLLCLCFLFHNSYGSTLEDEKEAIRAAQKIVKNSNLTDRLTSAIVAYFGRCELAEISYAKTSIAPPSPESFFSLFSADLPKETRKAFILLGSTHVRANYYNFKSAKK